MSRQNENISQYVLFLGTTHNILRQFFEIDEKFALFKQSGIKPILLYEGDVNEVGTPLDAMFCCYLIAEGIFESKNKNLNITLMSLLQKGGFRKENFKPYKNEIKQFLKEYLEEKNSSQIIDNIGAFNKKTTGVLNLFTSPAILREFILGLSMLKLENISDKLKTKLIPIEGRESIEKSAKASGVDSKNLSLEISDEKAMQMQALRNQKMAEKLVACTIENPQSPVFVVICGAAHANEIRTIAKESRISLAMGLVYLFDISSAEMDYLNKQRPETFDKEAIKIPFSDSALEERPARSLVPSFVPYFGRDGFNPSSSKAFDEFIQQFISDVKAERPLSKFKYTAPERTDGSDEISFDDFGTPPESSDSEEEDKKQNPGLPRTQASGTTADQVSPKSVVKETLPS